MKTAIRFTVFVGSFLIFWLLLAQIDWMERLSINEVSQNTEEKLSEFIKEQIERSEDVIKHKDIINTIDSLVHIIADANDMESKELKVVVVNNSQVNAFALPKGYMVINSGLIAACKSPEALCGVIAHELSHIELKHVERKLLKELGVAVLISSTTGGGGDMVKEIIKVLTSTAYDRSLEQEADENAVAYLIKAQIDPEPLAAFFYELSLSEPEMMAKLNWVSTHDDSKERAESIMEQIDEQEFRARPVLDQTTWDKLKLNIEEFNN